MGIKGTTVDSAVSLPTDAKLDPKSANLKADVDALLQKAGIDRSFEYIKKSGSTLTTRPTSRTYYVLKVANGSVEATQAVPDLQKRLIELHKGHGPLAFKWLQRIIAIGLIFAILAGLWLALSERELWRHGAIATGAGLVVAVVLGFFL